MEWCSHISHIRIYIECRRYLIARKVRIGHINKHISVARKVNNFLESGAAEGSEVRKHAARMESWLGTLEAQLTASAPNNNIPEQDGVPDIELAWQWSRQFAESTLQHINNELESTGQIGYNTAWNNQMALMALMICGTEAPPCRLFHLKTVLHPRYNGKFPCADPDCNTRNCQGNRVGVVYKEGYVPGNIVGSGGDAAATNTADVAGEVVGDYVPGEGGHDESDDLADIQPSVASARPSADVDTAAEDLDMWHFDWGLVDVQNVLVHSKNDRRGNRSELKYTFPEGILTKLFLTHIHQGHRVSGLFCA